MRNIVRNVIIVVVLAALAALAIMPPQKKLRLGKDLRGGSSLVYQVLIEPGEPAREVLAQVIEVIKERLDPKGLLEISIVAQGTDRIEITMPLPNKKTLALRAAFKAELEKLKTGQMTRREFEQLAEATPDAAREAFKARSGGSETLLNNLLGARDAFMQYKQADKQYRDQDAEVEDLRRQLADLRLDAENVDPTFIEGLELALGGAEPRLIELADAAAGAQIAYERQLADALPAPIAIEEVEQALLKDTTPIRARDASGKVVEFESKQEAAILSLKERYPTKVGQLDTAIASWETYQGERSSLDDTSDIIRLLRGAGVLTFRITVDPGAHPEEQRLRQNFRENGPRASAAADARWFRINRIESWYDNDLVRLEAMRADPAGYFATQMGYVVEEFAGDYFMLSWDRPGDRLTDAEGQWRVSRAFQGMDELGRPSINFEMDTLGAKYLGQLTSAHEGDNMAILLDDQVYSAPNLRSTISKNGQITGTFTIEEINYIRRVLGSGSLAAKLSPEPISQSTLGPDMGADNLRQGLLAGKIALSAVSVFMVLYYFMFGGIAVLALGMNALLLLGAMSVNRAAFTLPGIAGIILTFGMAVDANVLIYERVREELIAGQDLKTSVRLGYQRALSSIVDGNVTNLIVCFVLGTVGTQEIKGFAITLGIGVVTTMYTALFVTRVLYTLLIDVGGIRKMRMLPIAIPAIHRALEPSIDWMRLRGIFLTISSLLLMMTAVLVFTQRSNLLDTEFVGGTVVDLQFKEDASGNPIKMTRQEVADNLTEIGVAAGQQLLSQIETAEVIPVDPDSDGVSSSHFRIKTRLTDADVVLRALSEKFRDQIDSKPPLQFDRIEIAEVDRAPVYPVLYTQLGRNLNNPAINVEVNQLVGGVAIVLENISPPTSKENLIAKLDQIRSQPDYASTLSRDRELIVLRGDVNQVESAAIVVYDARFDYFEDEQRWEAGLAQIEWNLTIDALSRTTTLAQVQSFSPAVAATFKAQAIVAILLSAVLICIYVWVRFGSFRYSAAAIVTAFHDVVIVVGLIALAEVIYIRAPALANALGILPFKIDLNLIAAILTILGYSLNDTIVVMDRIRENRGKLPYASRRTVNLSINQTLSRTIITSGTTLIATAVLYVVGGEGVREFAYALLLGLMVGTYSSIAIASPMVWVHKADPTSGMGEEGEQAENETGTQLTPA